MRVSESRLIVAAIQAAVLVLHVFILFFGIRNTPRDPGDQVKDGTTTAVLMLLLLIQILAVHALGIYVRLGGAVPDWLLWGALPQTDLVLFAGLAIFLVGFAIRYRAVSHLGKLFTFQVSIRTEHTVIQDGPYRFIRHPAYLGSSLVLLGSALGNSFGIGILYNLLLCAVVYGLRIPHEERQLIEHLGEPYRQYMARTKRLIPHVY